MYTDEFPELRSALRTTRAVKHSVGEYVRDMAHTNGIESFWSMLKRGYTGGVPPDVGEASGAVRCPVRR